MNQWTYRTLTHCTSKAVMRWFDRTYVCTFDCYASYVVDVFIIAHWRWGSICRRNVVYALSRFVALTCKVISSSTLTASVISCWTISFLERVNSITKEAGFAWLVILVILVGFSLAALMTRFFTFFLYSVDILRCLCAWDNLHHVLISELLQMSMHLLSVSFRSCGGRFLVRGFWIPNTTLSRISDSPMHSQKLHVCESVRNVATTASNVSSGDWFRLLNT